MVDGLMSLFLLVIMLFIFIGGWLDQQLHLLGWRASRIISFLFVLWLLTAIYVPYKQYSINALAVLLPIIGFILMKGQTFYKVMVIVWSSILIAFFYNLLLYAFMVEPVLIVVEERILIGGLFGILIGFLYIPLKYKWIISTLGLWLGALYFCIHQITTYHSVSVLSYYELDLLFIIYFTATVTHCIITYFGQHMKKIRRMPPFS